MVNSKCPPLKRGGQHLQSMFTNSTVYNLLVNVYWKLGWRTGLTNRAQLIFGKQPKRRREMGKGDECPTVDLREFIVRSIAADAAVSARREEHVDVPAWQGKKVKP